MTRTRFLTQDPTIVSRHRTKFSRPGHLACCIYVLLLSALRVGQACDFISPSVIAASWTPNWYCCSVKASPGSSQVCLKPFCLAVPFCQPFIITRHTSWLFTFAKYSRRDHCGTEVCSDCMGYVRRCGNLMAEMCFCCSSTGGWA